MGITTLDLTIIGAYLTGIFTLAFLSGKKSPATARTSIENEQYLAGKSLTFFESLCSIIATEVSALTFLGIPAFSYGADFSFIHIYLGALIGRIIIAKVFLPKIYNQGLTIYTVMAKNGTKWGQKFIAIFYAINKFLAVGVRLFSGSILISEFFNLSIYWAVGIICLITFFYTLIGGLKAVVRTDIAQMFLFITGGIVAHYLIADVDGRSWSELIGIASSAGKTSIMDFSNLSSFIVGVIGGILFDMATHGVDQDFVQRLTGNRSLVQAQRAIMYSSFVSIAVGLLFLGIGALLWSHYQAVMPPNLPNDQLFAYFITNHFPDGVRGLMVAGVLAATMSTLDSTINALSATFFSDIFHHKTQDQNRVSRMYAIDTLVITLLLMGISFIAAKSDGILILGLKITSWTAGSLVCLFMATVVFKQLKIKLDAIGVLGAYLFGILGVYLNNNILVWPWQWNVYFGFVFSFIFLLLKKVLRPQGPKL